MRLTHSREFIMDVWQCVSIMLHKEAVCGKRVDLVICVEADTLKCDTSQITFLMDIWQCDLSCCTRCCLQQKADLLICNEAHTFQIDTSQITVIIHVWQCTSILVVQDVVCSKRRTF